MLVVLAVFYNEEPFAIEIDTFTIPGLPGVQSYAWGKSSDGRWLILGGRLEGLHRMRPFESFLPQYNNTYLIVVDPESRQFWTADVNLLPTSIAEQLQSTNQQFYQRDGILYVIGGYGYSPTEGDHITYPYITAIVVDSVVDAIVNNRDFTPFFRQIMDSAMAVTGGQLGYLDSVFYLAGGHYFKGRYDPVGVNFIQRYTNEVRMFKIYYDQDTMFIYDYTAVYDSINLHRRDYNMSPQVFPNGRLGFTMFSGVFRYDANLPWFHTVDVLEDGIYPRTDFNQLLANYHSAKVPIYDSIYNVMHTVFFGGIAQYYFNDQNELVEDTQVPFVRTISKVTRYPDWFMLERKLNIEMPGYMGAGAEFIPANDSFYSHEILYLSRLPYEKVLVGYIFGGIHSSLPNIFFINDGTQSWASNVIFRVYVIRGETQSEEIVLNPKDPFNMTLEYQGDRIVVDFFSPSSTQAKLLIYSLDGKLVSSMLKKVVLGRNSFILNRDDFTRGIYVLALIIDGRADTRKFVVR